MHVGMWESWALLNPISERDEEEMASGGHIVKGFFNPDPFWAHFSLWETILYRMIQDYVWLFL